MMKNQTENSKTPRSILPFLFWLIVCSATLLIICGAVWVRIQNHEAEQLNANQQEIHEQYLELTEQVTQAKKDVIAHQSAQKEDQAVLFRSLEKAKIVDDLADFKSDHVIAHYSNETDGMVDVKFHLPKGQHTLLVQVKCDWVNGKNKEGFSYDPTDEDFRNPDETGGEQFSIELQGNSRHWLTFGVPKSTPDRWTMTLTSKGSDETITRRFDIEKCSVNGSIVRGTTGNRGIYEIPNQITGSDVYAFMHGREIPRQPKIYLVDFTHVLLGQSSKRQGRLSTNVSILSEEQMSVSHEDALKLLVNSAERADLLDFDETKQRYYLLPYTPRKKPN